MPQAPAFWWAFCVLACALLCRALQSFIWGGNPLAIAAFDNGGRI
jgi:hypothetical protein